MAFSTLNDKQALALALVLLACSVSGLMLTVESLTASPVTDENAFVTSAVQPTIAARTPATVSPPPSGSTLTLQHPAAALDSANKQLKVQLDMLYTQGDKSWQGKLEVAGQPRLDNDSKRFYLEQPVIQGLTVAGLPSGMETEIRAVLAAELPQYFDKQAVYAPMEAQMLVAKDWAVEVR